MGIECLGRAGRTVASHLSGVTLRVQRSKSGHPGNKLCLVIYMNFGKL